MMYGQKNIKRVRVFGGAVI